MERGGGVERAKGRGSGGGGVGVGRGGGGGGAMMILEKLHITIPMYCFRSTLLVSGTAV